MPCLIGCLALFFPRAAIVALVVFSNFLERAFQTTSWPCAVILVGFLFLPYTTLTYAAALNWSATGEVSPLGVAFVVLALLADLSSLGGSGVTYYRQRRQVRVVDRR